MSNSIVAESYVVASPCRTHASRNLDKKQQEIVKEVTHVSESGLCSKADADACNGNYTEALEKVKQAINRLKKLQDYVRKTGSNFYEATYVEVTRPSQGRVRRAAKKYGNKQCVLGGLKSVRQELEQAVEMEKEFDSSSVSSSDRTE